MFLLNADNFNQFVNTNTANTIHTNPAFPTINTVAGTEENITNKLAQVWITVNTEINDFFQLPDWEAKTRLAITGDWSANETQDFFSHISPENINVEILPANNMPGIAGGYDAITGKIYLSENLVKYSDPAKIAEVLIEEISHKADDILNPGQDSPGDEGEILAKLVSNQGNIPTDWQVLKQEDDHKFIQVGNSWIGVETSSVIPNISIPSITLLEGDVAGQTNAIFNVSLDQITDQIVTLKYTTTDDLSAKSGIDFTATSGSINFSPGETTKIISIPVISDKLVENNERFLIKFSEAINGRLANIQATATITNDDLPNISVQDIAIQEGNIGQKNALFKVELDQISSQTVTLQYKTVTGTTDTKDFLSQTGTIQFPPRSTTQIISVPIIGDTLWETDETFSIQLSNATNGIITKSQAVATITNDDFPNISIEDASIPEGNVGQTNAQFKVKLDQPIGQDLTLKYRTIPITAIAGSDFIATAEEIKFLAGETEQIINIPVIGNTVVAKNKKFTVQLSEPSIGKIIDYEAVGTILNDDLPKISIGDVSISEGNEGQKNARFEVTLDQKSNQKVTVKYKTVTSTADNQDFTSRENEVEFLPNIDKQIINIPIQGDTLWEPDEQFFVELSDANNGIIDKSQGIGTITNDDFPNISIEGTSILEGNAGQTNAEFKVKLNQPIGEDLTLKYKTAGLSAVSNNDFVAQVEEIKIPAGATEYIINIPVIGNTVVEKDKKFTVELSEPSIGKLTNSKVVGTIINDDFSKISIGDISIREGNEGQKNARFAVTLDQKSSESVTLKYETVVGTADTKDFKPQTGNIQFRPGLLKQTISIPIFGDSSWEPDETFVVKLSDADKGTIIKEEAIATILNDDMPSISIEDVNIQEGNSGKKNAKFKVKLDQVSGENISVKYKTNGLSAVSGSDFLTKLGEVKFLPGQKQKIIAIPIIGDKEFENDEKFTVQLSEANNAKISKSQAIGTIINDDKIIELPNISIKGVNIVEGNSGQKNASFVVELDKVSSNTITLKYDTIDIGAKAGQDYIAKQGEIKFAPGEKSKTINIPVKGDSTLETDEKFIVRLSSAKNGKIVKNQGQGIIISDDYTPISETEPDNDVMSLKIPTFNNLIPEDISVKGFIGYNIGGNQRDTNDYYGLVLDKSNREYNVEISLDSLSDNAQFDLYTKDGTHLYSSDAKGLNPRIFKDILPNGRYYVRVYPKGTAKTEYNLSMKRIITF